MEPPTTQKEPFHLQMHLLVKSIGNVCFVDKCQFIVGQWTPIYYRIIFPKEYPKISSYQQDKAPSSGRMERQSGFVLI